MVIAELSLAVPEALGERQCGRCNASQQRYLRNNASEGLEINLHCNGLAGCFTLISILLLTNEL